MSKFNIDYSSENKFLESFDKLAESGGGGDDDLFDILGEVVGLDPARCGVTDSLVEIIKLKEENKKLKELTEGIMDEEGTQHILGCNAYEKFCQAMCELNHDEEWIKELKEEIKKVKEEHNKFDEIWKTEGITEQDIIDMKRQISNQCDLIKKQKNKIRKLKRWKQVVKHEVSQLVYMSENTDTSVSDVSSDED